MNRVKITVLKTTLDEELAKEYGAEGLKACPMLRAVSVGSTASPSPAATANTRDLTLSWLLTMLGVKWNAENSSRISIYRIGLSRSDRATNRCCCSACKSTGPFASALPFGTTRLSVS